MCKDTRQDIDKVGGMMNRSEFLTELRIALQGEISQIKVNENLHYYENYIVEESRKGRMEEQVIEELGSPRLIAKTIIDTTDQPIEYEQAEYKQQYEEQEKSIKDQHPRGFHINYDETNGWDIRYGKFKINSWYGTLTIVLITVLIIFLVANITIALIPIVLPILLIMFAFYLFFGKRK